MVLFTITTALPQETQDLWFTPLYSLPKFSPSANYWVHHHSEGYIYISSMAGLNRFDGTGVKHYSSILGDSTSMADDNIQSGFYEDSQGNLWFSTATAINCYRPDTDDFLQIPADSLPCVATYVHVFFLEKDKFLWYSTGEGIYRFNILSPPKEAMLVFNTPTQWFAVDTSANGKVRFLYSKEDNRKNDHFFWEINEGEVVKSERVFDEPDIRKAPKRLNSIYTDTEGISWVGTDMGLVKWPRRLEEAWEFVLGSGFTNCYIAHWEGDTIAGWSAENGPFIYDTGDGFFTRINVHTLEATDLTYQKVFNLYIDEEDNLWAPFYSSGLMYANLKKTKFRSLPKITFLDGKRLNYSYWSFFESDDNSFWYGSSTEGLFRLNGQDEHPQHFMPDPNNPYSLPDDWITCFGNGKDGKIYIGTRHGLAYFDPGNDPGRFHHLKIEGDTIEMDISDICQTKYGLLVSTENRGIFHVDEENEKPRLIKIRDEGSPYGTMYYDDGSGNLFICRNDDEIQIFPFENGLLSKPLNPLPIKGVVSGYWKDIKKDILWVASFSGLVQLDLGKMEVVKVFTEKDGLPTKNIHSILGDDFHNLWLGTPQGLVSFNTVEEEFRTYSLADGALSTEFYIHSAIRRKNGELWFGGTNGITIVPDSIRPDIETKPKIKLTGLWINEQKQPLEVLQQKELFLNHQENTLAFEFVAMEYSDPANIQLSYQLVNADDVPVSLPKGNYGNPRYPDLRYGKYTLQVWALNSDGVSETAEEELMIIEIDKPWYIKWWAIFSYILLLTGVLYAYYRYRIALIRKEENYKRQLAELRQKEAEAKQQVAETETAILRLQMNPHFIFNSMNSINSYILKKDIDTASGYLNRFSRLMRMILDLAANPYISVYEEAELLELYIQTEAMRFEEKFSYEIKVDDALDPDDTVLPTMILQPFVENAIWHGISGKGIKGHIKVHFQKLNDSLVCSIEDNGMGRNAAQANTGKKAHVSKALGITAHRLKLLENETGKPAHFIIIDLKGDSGEAAGTKVVLTLPII